MSFMSWIGLPLERVYSFIRMAPSSPTRTHFDEVEPPSRPTTPRTTSPGSKRASVKVGGA